MEEDSRQRFIRLTKERFGPSLSQIWERQYHREWYEALEQVKRDYPDLIPDPKPKPKTRGTSKETDKNAREAQRLYREQDLTQAQIAERLSVSVSTAKRWLKRKLPEQTE